MLLVLHEDQSLPWKTLYKNLARYGLVLEGWPWPVPLPNLFGVRVDRGISGLTAAEMLILFEA